jgi:hypothetical protein
VVDQRFLADGKVTGDEVTTTTFSSPVRTRRGNQVKKWWHGVSSAMGMADATTLFKRKLLLVKRRRAKQRDWHGHELH